MSNPTRQEIIDAHEALKSLIAYDLADAYTEADVEEVCEREQLIRKFLPPKPQPTMDEIKWDDEKHYLAEAEHVDWGKVIMLYYDGQFNRIQYFCKLDEPNMVVYSDPANLTPTGKRYTLTEVQDG